MGMVEGQWVEIHNPDAASVWKWFNIIDEEAERGRQRGWRERGIKREGGEGFKRCTSHGRKAQEEKRKKWAEFFFKNRLLIQGVGWCQGVGSES